ncbi:MAG: hypothetical protein ACK4J0_01315 [Candidatus Anstonellaceae archaeon]
MNTKKGYFSFLLFSLICIILLYPLFFYTSPFPLWPSFVLKDTFNNHVLQKRAIQDSTYHTFIYLKPAIIGLKNAKTIKEGLVLIISSISLIFPPAAAAIPLIEVMGESVANLASSYQAREAFIKLSVFLAWEDISSKWAENSNYSLSLNCINPFSSLPFSFPSELFKSLNLDPDTLSNIPFYLSCYTLLEYQDSADPANAGKLIIHPGVEVQTTNKLTNATASSQLLPFEVV